ncbi:hypothetical protein [Bradyrhizobium sp. USDA 4486]
MASPSIIPNDRLDKDFYLVLEDFRDGAAFRETDEGIDHATLIEDLLSGQYGKVLWVVAFNPVEGWSRDASENVVRELEHRIAAEGRRDHGWPEGFYRESSRPHDRRAVGAAIEGQSCLTKESPLAPCNRFAKPITTSVARSAASCSTCATSARCSIICTAMRSRRSRC